jgi:signal peptidase I
MRRNAGLIVVRVGLALVFVVSGLGFLVIKTLWDSYSVPSEAMAPSLNPGDRILVSPGNAVSRGEVVAYGCQEVMTCVKRAVAIGGDTVEAREGRLIVNGEVVDEDYLAPDTRTEDFGPFDLAADEIFLLGDNRLNSQDSRFHGPVSLSAVSGIVVAVNMPLDWILLGVSVVAGIAFVVLLLLGRRRRNDGSARVAGDELVEHAVA